MKAARDSGEDFYTQSAKTTFWEDTKNRLELWEEQHLKDPILALDEALKCVEDQYQVDYWLETFCGIGLQWPGSGMVPKMRGKPLWESVWLFLESVGQRSFAHSLHALERPKEVRTAR